MISINVSDHVCFTKKCAIGETVWKRQADL